MATRPCQTVINSLQVSTHLTEVCLHMLAGLEHGRRKIRCRGLTAPVDEVADCSQRTRITEANIQADVLSRGPADCECESTEMPCAVGLKLECLGVFCLIDVPEGCMPFNQPRRHRRVVESLPKAFKQ